MWMLQLAHVVFSLVATVLLQKVGEYTVKYRTLHVYLLNPKVQLKETELVAQMAHVAHMPHPSVMLRLSLFMRSVQV